MPGAAIRVGVRVRGLRERPVDLTPLLRGGRPVDGRADERVAECHSGGERQQAFRFQNVCGGRRDPEPFCRAPHQRRVADRVRSRHEQEAARIPRQPLQSPHEALLDAGGDGHSRRQTEAARELGRGQPAWQFEQCERVPTGLSDDPLQHALIQARRQDRLQQRPRIAMTEGHHVKLRQIGERLTHFSGREHEGDPLGEQSARHEGQRPRGGDVEPLGVVHDAEQRPLLGRLGQQPEDRQADQEPIRRRAGRESERDAERLALRLGQAVQKVQEGRAKLLSRGERDLHLCLDADRPGEAKRASGLRRILEQGGLADARFAVEHQHAPASAARAVQQPVERRTFTITT